MNNVATIMHLKREDFPIFKAHPSLCYLDNAATTQKPQAVIDAMSHFYAHGNASAYRGFYKLAEQATESYEAVRAYCADFIGAQKNDIVFTHGATEAINMVASSWASAHLAPGDEIVLSELEHHANILPWQRVAKERGAVIKWIRVNFDGSISIPSIEEAITPKTKLVAITASSNVLGHIDLLAGHEDFLRNLIKKAHMVGARVLVDAAQLVPHRRFDVVELDCDFLVFSSHKMLGPTGVGVLYVHPTLQASMAPYQLGGGMVADVRYHDADFKPYPALLEAGTLSLAEVIGFGAALRYLDEQGNLNGLATYESELVCHLVDEMQKSPEITLLSRHDAHRSHLVTFVVDGIHAHDIAHYLDNHNIAVRAGNHCAQLLHKRLGIQSSLRISFYGYNTHQEVDYVATTLRQALSLYGTL